MRKATLMRPSVCFDDWFRSEEIRLFLFFPFWVSVGGWYFISLSSLALLPLPIDDWAWSLPPPIGLRTYRYRKVVVCGSD